MKDGGLRTLFRLKYQQFQWTSVETAGTASGIPDSEFCTPDGIQGWIEFKQTSIFHVQIKPFQVAWLTQRCRYGGNAWIAVRRVPTAQKYDDVDELWLMRGDQANRLFYDGLTGTHAMVYSNGPRNWNYDEIEKILKLKLQF
jgi:hypothetical protein